MISAARTNMLSLFNSCLKLDTVYVDDRLHKCSATEILRDIYNGSVTSRSGEMSICKELVLSIGVKSTYVFGGVSGFILEKPFRTISSLDA